MPAPVFTWVDVVGPPAAPFASGPYQAKIQIDLSSYIGYYQVSASSDATISTSFPGRLHLAEDASGNIYDLIDETGFNVTGPIIKASSVASSMTGIGASTNINRRYVTATTATDYLMQFIGLELVNATIGPSTGKFALEIPGAMRTQLVTWYGELAKVPTHIIIWSDDGGSIYDDFGWFNTGGYSTSLHYVHAIGKTSPTHDIPFTVSDKVGNRGIVGTPMVALDIYDANGTEVPGAPVIVGSSVYWSDRPGRGGLTFGDFIPIALGLSCRCFGYQQEIVVSPGAPAFTPSNQVTYYDGIGGVLGTQTLTGAWTYIGTSGGFDVYQATDQTFTLVPPTGTVWWSFTGNSDTWIGYGHGWFTGGAGGVPFTIIQPYALQCLDGAGVFLPGVLLKAYP